MRLPPRPRLTLARVVLALALAGALLVAFCTPRLHGAPTRHAAGGPLPLPACDAATSLSCLELVATPDLPDARGVAVLEPVPSPFGVAVTADGRHRRRLVLHVRGLPAPSTLGPYEAYVAWSTTLSLDSVVRLGEVRDGRVELGETTREQFRVLVSAERSAGVAAREGRLVLRGTSPGTRLLAHRDLLGMWRAGVARDGPPGSPPRSRHSTGRADAPHHSHASIAVRAHEDSSADAPTRPRDSVPSRGREAPAWPMPPVDPRLSAMPGAHTLAPRTAPYRPARGLDLASLPEARPSRRVAVRSGDTLRLVAMPVRRTIGGKTFAMLGFDGEYPGPLLDVAQGATVVVRFVNRIDMPSAVHWHGVRLDNRYDGVPDLTQRAVAPGDSFTYVVRFPDAGLYWYHPHVREDVQQDLGLYGAMLVRSAHDELGPAHREVVLMLDDLLVDDDGAAPHGADAPTHALMGRFGNVLLVNGEPRWSLDVRRGEVVRLRLANASNARVFNVSLPGARMKVVGSDVGLFEREEWVESVVLAPAERYTVDVRFDTAGTIPLVHAFQRLDHMLGTLTPEVDTMGVVTVRDGRATPDLEASFSSLREHADAARELAPMRAWLDRSPDRTLVLTMRTRDLDPMTAAMMTGAALPVDWNDGMPMTNWATTSREVEWIVRDSATGRENMDAHWTFRRGERVKIRIVNDAASPHGMDHPIHLHGQRFVVLSRDGVATRNLVWKDTAVIPAGETVDLVVEMSNPGRWMLHCHIAEHLGTGMMMVFEVASATK